MDARCFACLFFCAAALVTVCNAVDITVPSSVLQFMATPGIVIPDEDTLYLNCTYNPPSNTDELIALTSMVISRYTGDDDTSGQPIFEEIVVFSESYGYTIMNHLDNEESYANLSAVSHSSYLNMVITNATSDQIGRYQCEANFLTVYGHNEIVYKEVVVAEGTSCSVDECYVAKDQLNCVHEAFSISESSGVGVTWLRNLLVSQNLFHLSTEYGNPINPSRYYLFSLSNYPSADEGEGACQALGGYLAEIDDIDEFNFITNFTQQYQLPTASNRIQSIYLGARDDRTEGQWYYRYSGKPMPSLGKFVAGEPNGGTAENCLVLWYYAAQHVTAIGDNQCNPSGAVTTSFLCEVPSFLPFHYSHTTNDGITCSYP